VGDLSRGCGAGGSAVILAKKTWKLAADHGILGFVAQPWSPLELAQHWQCGQSINTTKVGTLSWPTIP
jgi:hypothetical protein